MSKRSRRERDKILKPPDDWLVEDTGLPPALADAFVRDLRAAGCAIWLVLDPHRPGNVRTRMMFPADTPHDDEIVRTLAKYARDIGKAVARSGEWNPPPENPWNDKPLPPGGHWEWFGR